MTNLTRFTASDLPELLDKISKNSIGMNEYLNRVFDLHETTSNYPPYNLIQVSNVESRLEIALAGFKKKEVMSTHKTENSLSKDKKKIKKPEQTTSIEEWLNDLSPDLGPSVMRRKLDQLNLRMGC